MNVPEVLLGFTLVVLQLASLAAFAAAGVTTTLWIVTEMTRYQRGIDVYNGDYARRHLDVHAKDRLRAFVCDENRDPETRLFVDCYLAAQRRVLPDGARPPA